MPSRYSSFDIEAPKIPSPFKKFNNVSDLVASCFMCFFCIINVFFLFIILFNHSLKLDSSFSELTPMINYIAANLNTAPVMSISKATNSICPTDSVLITLATWPGTTTGCYCSQRGTLYAGECAKSDQNVCSTVSPVSPQTISIWNTESYCIRRVLDDNFYFKTALGSCLEGYNDCGTACLKQESVCPITGLSIVSSSDQDPSADSETVELSQGRTLVISRDTTNNTVFDLEVSLNDLPCLQPGYYPAYNGFTYPLLNIESYQGCGIYGSDVSVTSLENLNFSTVISQNGLTSVQNLPLYLSNEDGAQDYLVSRPRIAIAQRDECLAIDTQRFGRITELISTFKNWVIVATIFPMVIIVLYFGFLVYLLFDEGLKKFFKKSTSTWASWIFYTVCFAAVIMYSRSLSGKNQDILAEETFYSHAGSTNCFVDSRISTVIHLFSEHIPTGTATIMNYVTAMFWISVFFYIAAFATTGYSLVYKTCCD